MSVCLRFRVSVFLCQFVIVSLWLCLCLCVCVGVCGCVSVSVCQCVSVSVCLCLSPSLSLYLSLWVCKGGGLIDGLLETLAIVAHYRLLK